MITPTNSRAADATEIGAKSTSNQKPSTRRVCTDDDRIGRAIRAYLRRCHNSGWVPRMPSLAACHVNRGTAIVANTYETLATYRVGRGRLVRIDPA